MEEHPGGGVVAETTEPTDTTAWSRGKFGAWRSRLRREPAPIPAGGAALPLEAVFQPRPRVTESPKGKASRERVPAVPYLRALPAKRGESSVARRTAWRDAMFRRTLAVADVLSAAAALALTQIIAGVEDVPATLYAGVLAVVLVSKVIGLYDRDELLLGKETLNEAPALFQLSTLYTLIVTTLAIGAGARLTVGAIGILWLALFVGTMVGRAGARSFSRALTPPERCVILGSQEQADAVRAKFSLLDTVHAEVVAYLPFERFELERPRDTDFARYVIERDIHRVIVAESDSSDHVLESVRYFKEYGLKVSVLPSILEVVGSSVVFDEIQGTTLLGVRSFGLSRSSRILKRGLDLVGSALLLLFGAPLLAAFALAIKLDTRGPVLFRQKRIGRDGLPFQMIKFRTMFDGADRLKADLLELNETDGLFKLANDPRVTRVGRFLRRTSLDELPQLINVLRGEMSLVGPRPLVEEEDRQVQGWHRRRLHLTPGMTGAWQIMGETRVPLATMVMMDYMYIVNWSLWSDVRILLQTVGHVLGRRGL